MCKFGYVQCVQSLNALIGKLASSMISTTAPFTFGYDEAIM